MKGLGYIVLMLALIFSACKGKKQISEDASASGAGSKVMAARQLKAVFIEAKKEQVIGNTTKAKSLFETVLAKDPKCIACAYELAGIAIKEKNANVAMKMSEMAVKAEPNNSFYKEQRAEIVYMLGNAKQAASISKSLVDSFPKTRMHYKRAVFYYEKSKMFDDAEIMLLRYEKQFGFTHQTAMMYDYLYDMEGDGLAKVSNWKKLVNKYPNDVSFRKSYINALIDESNYPEALNALDALKPKLSNPSYTYLVKSRINSIQKDWPAYIANVNLFANDSLTDAAVKTRYLVESIEIKDTGILAPLRKIASEDASAYAYLDFYMKQFGKQTNRLVSLEREYLAKPGNKTIASKLSKMYYATGKFNKAAEVSLDLVGRHPSFPEYYYLHAQNIMAQGQYADAYSYANQGLVYAISAAEIAQSHLLQAEANHYLNNGVNVKEELSKAWAANAQDAGIQEQLVYLSMLHNLFLEKRNAVSVKGSYVVSLQKLFASDNYSVSAWQALEKLYPNNVKIIEARMLTAKRLKNEVEFNLARTKLRTKFPKHTYFQTIKAKENGLIKH